MVDYNTETAITAPHNIVKIEILEARYNTRLAIEFMEQKKKYSSRTPSRTFQARLQSYYYTLYGLLNNKGKNEIIAEKVFSNKIEDNIKAFLMLEEILYKVGLIRIDRRQFNTLAETDASQNV